MDDSTLKILAIDGRRDSLPVLRAGMRETSPDAQLSVALERPAGSERVRLDGSDQILLDPLTEEAEKVRTQQHTTAEALGEDQQWYQAIFEQAGDCLLLLEVGPDGIPLIVDVNESGLRVHGYTRAELVGRPISLLEPAWTPEVSAARQRSTRAGRGLFPVHHRRKDGSFFDAEARAGVIHAGTRTLFLTVERDLTEQKRTQEQALQQWTELLHLSRLNTLGEMAAALAHELNQPLSAIVTYGGACLRQAQAPAPDSGAPRSQSAVGSGAGAPRPRDYGTDQGFCRTAPAADGRRHCRGGRPERRRPGPGGDAPQEHRGEAEAGERAGRHPR